MIQKTKTGAMPICDVMGKRHTCVNVTKRGGEFVKK